MPELPDLEVARKYVNATSLHQKIRSVEVRDARILGDISARGINDALTGRFFEATRRHGKNLFVGSDGGGWMLVHLGMTGRLWYFRDMDNDPPHDRFLISFEGGYHLALDDSRMFGKVDLLEDPDEYIRRKKLGPDPLSLDAASFRERLEGRRGGVKAALMNQQVVAGIGNIYSDEILFQSYLHPMRGVAGLDGETLEELHTQTLRVLGAAIARAANPQELPDSYLLPHRREGERCPRNNGDIQSTRAAGRTAYYCPACQPERS
jgi:formamidopyrimidine-DNA glycosylase